MVKSVARFERGRPSAERRTHVVKSLRRLESLRLERCRFDGEVGGPL